MRTMSVSEFKATCLALFDEIARGGEPVTITKRGVPVAQVGPPPTEQPRRRVLGRLAGTIEIRGDLIAPVFDPADLEEMFTEWDDLQ